MNLWSKQCVIRVNQQSSLMKSQRSSCKMTTQLKLDKKPRKSKFIRFCKGQHCVEIQKPNSILNLNDQAIVCSSNQILKFWPNVQMSSRGPVKLIKQVKIAHSFYSLCQIGSTLSF